MPDARGYSKRQPAFTDLDKMSFDKFKDKILQDVPAYYLKWLYDEMKPTYEHARVEEGITPKAIIEKLKLFNYIHNSIDAILMELGESKRR